MHATTGTIYSSAHLTKVAHYAKNYSHTTFTRTNQAKVKKSNGKVAIYQYIKAGNTKGWIWHSYLKDGSAPSTTSSSQDAKASVPAAVKNWKPGHMTSFNANWYKVPAFHGHGVYKGFDSRSMYNRAISESKKIKGIKKGTVKANNIGFTDGYCAMATLTNGHQIYWKVGAPGHATEIIPGIISQNQVASLKNHSSHYVCYFVDNYAYNNDNVSGHEQDYSIFGNNYKNPAGYKTYYDGGYFPNFATETNFIVNSSKKIMVASAQVYMDQAKDNLN